MPSVAGVMLRRIKDKTYAEVSHHDIRPGDEVILETEHGVEFGVVFEKEKEIQKGKEHIGKIIRKVTEEDRKKINENAQKAEKVFPTVLEKAKNHELDMKLTYVQYTFDRSKLFVYYTSETRVDFRELIKDLGHVLKTRIQMVQIGVRDESKIVGGIGTCGQVLCCQSFLKDFNSVTIDMAKEQELSLNTTKLSGLCGRLMCCIAYENDTYKNIKKELPRVGETISTPNGKARLAAIDCIKEIITADFGNKDFKTFPISQIKELNKRN
ncbi:PSP1 domain-containing protein [Endomicrobium proavitum]|uniref:PSP1-like protein n=1 Tax=Endomicrobium proavitum TaxID=1408281 RepID=A0A0G3WGF1_9BACT|nr:regulatory iron-sulfur-containing complex subunit RicT [Endomicrobium proavitum]AKL97443.1 PSP1-like protein [Endomicrobium proavitum]